MVARVARPTHRAVAVFPLLVFACPAAGVATARTVQAQTAQAQTLPGRPAVAAPAGQSRPDPASPTDAAPDPAAELGEALEAMPDIGVGWPDLGPDLATPPGAPVAVVPTIATTDAAAERRYGWRLDGMDGIGSALLRQRFADLSSLEANDRQPANAAQLDRRAREDAALVQTLLRGEGYYDARVTTTIEPGDKPLVVLTAEPGTLYRFRAVTIEGIAAAGDKAAGLTRAFGVAAGDPVNADAVVAGQQALTTAVGRQGFAFGTVADPEIVVDRSARTATLTMAVAPGAALRFGQVVALPGNRVFDAAHIQDIARFRPGDSYDAGGLDDLRRALIQTSLVSSVTLRPVAGTVPGTVDIAAQLEPAPPRTVAGELGYGTGEGARAELSWTHRNLFPSEGALTVRGVLGTREQLGSLIFRRSNIGARDRVLTVQMAAAHTQRDAYEADTFLLSGTLERQSNIFFQKTWVWSLGAELIASDERDVEVATGAPRRRTFFIGALPASLGYDGSDDLLDPTRGWRLAGRISPEASLQDNVFGYTRTQIDASRYVSLPGRVVIAARTRIGTILGAPRDQIAPSRRFYAGGGASVRGYGYQSIGPRDPNNDPIGGRSLAEFSLEARIRLSSIGFPNVGVVPYLDAGNIYTSTLPKFSGLRYGAGLGVRYYSSFGPIRLDVGTPINPQPGDSRLAVYVSLGQAF